MPSIMPTSRSVSPPAGSTPRTARSAASGNATTAPAAINAASDSRPAIWAPRASDTPPTTTPAGKSDMSNPAASRPMTASPSKTRSTATEDMAAVKRTPESLVAAKTRTSSPARKGRMLLAMKPIAVACQSGHGLSAAPDSSRSSSRQRINRMGKVIEASTTPSARGQGSASRIWRKTSPM